MCLYDKWKMWESKATPFGTKANGSALNRIFSIMVSLTLTNNKAKASMKVCVCTGIVALNSDK